MSKTVKDKSKSKKAKNSINEQQKRAIEFENGPLLVVAGAGTGKTRVITERIKHLIQERETKSSEILALTFTEKASAEMADRVGDIMPLGYGEPWIYTFHSFADRILRNEGLEIGLDTSYKVLSSTEQYLLIRKNLFKFGLNYFLPLGNPTKFIWGIIKFISRLQDEYISPEDFQRFANGFAGDEEEKKRWQELAGFYTNYQKIKIAKSKMDFGDLINWTVRLFKTRPNVLKRYQNQFKHIMVDEFQDTNYAQYELIKLLFPNTVAEKEGNLRSLLTVGDDSQAIYRFRGAAVSNILEFMEDFPKAETITLLQNYRSSQNILDPAYKLIQNNNPDTLESKLKISKKLVSEIDKKGILPQVFELETMEGEVDVVLRTLMDIIAKEPQYSYKDFAILARANNHLDPFLLALRKSEIPYQLVGSRGLYDRDEIRNIIALLRVIVNPDDGISLYRVLNIPCLNVSREVIAGLFSLAKLNKTPLWQVVKESENEQVKFAVEKALECQTSITKKTPSEILYNLVRDIKFIDELLKEETLENQLAIKNLDLFLNIVKNFEVSYRNENKELPTLIDFVEYLNLMTEAGENPSQAEIEDIDTVNLLTVHASKGLEFPVVFMVNLVSDRFPTRDKSDQIPVPDELVKESLPVGDSHIQEERRLFYVGLTRAKKYLFLTYAQNYGGKRDKKRSGFVDELKLQSKPFSYNEISKNKKQAALFGIESGFRDTKSQKLTSFTPESLSYSAIEAFEECPLKYKYGHILKIPTPPSHALTFGTTIHNTLKDFHTSLSMGNKLTLDDLYEMYENNWDPAGYIDQVHREKQFEHGKKLLKEYYKKNIDSNIKPEALEKWFNLRIGGIKFNGRIDRIDSLAGGKVEIIDYKTGSAKNQKDVDKNDQLSFYALGATEFLGLKPEKLSLYFLETNEKFTTKRTPKQLAEVKNKIVETIKEISKGEFKATPGRHCEYCPYNEICPFAHKG